DVPSPDKRAKYHLALLSSLDDQQLDIQPRNFADRYADAHDRPALLARVAERGLDVGTAFQKDTSLIQRRIRGFRIVFDSGMVLVGREEDLKSRLDLRPNDGPNPGADISDTI